MSDPTPPFIRTVLGDRDPESVAPGVVYGHEHLIIDSPLIAERFPHIHLHSTDAAVVEVGYCRDAGAALMIDCMPVAAGRDVARLAEISRRSAVDVVATTGLHHDRYYGPLHWSNRVDVDTLTELFIQDLIVGVDAFDYTSPVLQRTPHRAGVVKAATSGPQPDERDRRNLLAVGQAAAAAGAPVLTHCEGGLGGLAQIDMLAAQGVPPSSIILSHVDKSDDPAYLRDLVDTGAVVELDQTLRQHDRGVESVTVRMIADLLDAGYGDRVIVGTDGARRSLWSTLGGSPGLAWLSSDFPKVLSEAGFPTATISDVMRNNALRALTWRAPA